MKYSRITLLAFFACVGAAFLTQGCTSNRQTSQLADVAYVAFEHVGSGLEFQVDEGDRITMKSSSAETLYAVPPGKRHVRVWSADSLVVDRTIFLAQGQSFKVILP